VRLEVVIAGRDPVVRVRVEYVRLEVVIAGRDPVVRVRVDVAQQADGVLDGVGSTAGFHVEAEVRAPVDYHADAPPSVVRTRGRPPHGVSGVRSEVRPPDDSRIDAMAVRIPLVQQQVVLRAGLGSDRVQVDVVREGLHVVGVPRGQPELLGAENVDVVGDDEVLHAELPGAFVSGVCSLHVPGC
jgi:hypothetical protein